MDHTDNPDRPARNDRLAVVHHLGGRVTGRRSVVESALVRIGRAAPDDAAPADVLAVVVDVNPDVPLAALAAAVASPRGHEAAVAATSALLAGHPSTHRGLRPVR